MNHAMLPAFLEGVVLLGLYLLAVVLTSGWRRRAGAGEQDETPSWRILLLRPLIVLVATHVLLWLMKRNGEALAWLQGHPKHMSAWLTFWVVVLVLGAIELIVLHAGRLAGRAFRVPRLMRNIIRGLALLLAAFAVLKYQLGVNISPLLASTALVTAVVGFALQGVLGNLLGGMSLHVVGSVMPGDWVAIGETEGEVIETNWRETRLRTVAGHVMVIPNSTVASSVVHNMTRPTPLRRHAVNVGASYSDAPGEVIEALLESARAVPEVLREPASSAYVVEYKDFGINYRLRFWTNKFYDRTAVEGDVMRMIWYQFKRRGIEIPFPMSDKLLNDFMAVVYRQRRMPPEREEVRDTARDLLHSDFVGKLLVDENGQSLLSETDLAGIAPSIRRVQFTAGETIFRQGEPGESCYVLVSGTVRGRVEYSDLRQANEFDLGPGALFGEMSLVTGLPRTATLVSPGETELLVISREAFAGLLAVRKEIPEALARIVAHRAEANVVALERLKSLGQVNVAESLKRENILSRFLRLLRISP